MSEPYQYPFGQPVTKADLEDSGTDTCIYVIARQAGEGADRKLKNKEYTLPKWNGRISVFALHIMRK